MNDIFNLFLCIMAATAVIVFLALQKVNAGYGLMFNPKWGPTLPNRWGWVLMESPVFLAMALLWACSDRRAEAVPLCFFLLFELHYFQRSFVFPFLLRGASRMPLSIVAMGVFFNLLNALMQGGWIFYLSPDDYYPDGWFADPRFLIGVLLFAGGMAINWHSDYIIRHLRQPGDRKHYLPRGGMFRFVASANYLGELVEWCGFALLTWSFSGAVFALWTAANLIPRAAATHRRYIELFGKEYTDEHRKRIIPFIY
ncbi:MAG: 3-oxo-5-alpha-steroid 4-dehydrogenase [Bacteroidaceae bacterium]|jgi:3-oxo-5-alpha-steroid 4-dehydrogenase 1